MKFSGEIPSFKNLTVVTGPSLSGKTSLINEHIKNSTKTFKKVDCLFTRTTYGELRVSSLDLYESTKDMIDLILPKSLITEKKTLGENEAYNIKYDVFCKHNNDWNSRLMGFVSVLNAIFNQENRKTLYIQYPEVFLSPEQQTIFGKILAKLSHSGCQTIVESNSEHIFNGIRLFVAENNLDVEDFSFVFINSGEVKNIKINQYLQFSPFPIGFSDISSKDMMSIIRLAKEKNQKSL